MVSENDKIKAKISKLLAKAEGGATGAEQDAFMAKVNQLLEEHQIGLHEVRGIGDNDPIVSIEGEVTRSHEWPSRVGFALAAYYGGKLIRFSYKHTKARYKYVVIGRQSACTTFELMFPFILTQTLKQSRQYARDYGITNAKAERNVGMALAARIWSLVPVAEERRTDLAKNALVPVSDVAAAVEKMFGKVGSVKQLARADYSAKAYADKVSLNRHVEGNGQLLIGSK
jgi:hypothetical protein